MHPHRKLRGEGIYVCMAGPPLLKTLESKATKTTKAADQRGPNNLSAYIQIKGVSFIFIPHLAHTNLIISSVSLLFSSDLSLSLSPHFLSANLSVISCSQVNTYSPPREGSFNIIREMVFSSVPAYNLDTSNWQQVRVLQSLLLLYI